MQAQITQIRPLATFHRRQNLPVAGTIMVRQGQNVSVGDVLAEATLGTGHALVDVTRALGLDSAEKAEELIDRKIGEQLGEKDIIAETGGIFSRVVRTPAPGTILSIQNGVVLIETRSEKIQLKAQVPGTVTQINGNRQVVIEISGALVQGVWGNGKSGRGPLVNRAETPDTALVPSLLDIGARGAFVMAGYCVDEGIFELAAHLPVEGLILGSMPSRLIETARRQPYPILLLEGFGTYPINPAAFSLLRTNVKREISVNACDSDPFNGIRPEAVIALPVEGEGLREQVEYAVGQQVRVTAYPYFGYAGIIEKILPGSALLPSGLRAPAAQVRFIDESRVIPLADLEIISLEPQVSGETE